MYGPEHKHQRTHELSKCLREIGWTRYALVGFDVHEGADHRLQKHWRGCGSRVETCIEVFGTERSMFESNFPVDKGSGSYHVLNAFKRIAANCSQREDGLVDSAAFLSLAIERPSRQSPKP